MYDAISKMEEYSADIPWFIEDGFNFIKFPKALFFNLAYQPLSLRAKVCYALLLDRTKLSYANDWRDNEHNVFVYYTLKSLAEILGCTEGRCTQAYRELEAAGLIRRKKQGQGKPARIEVLPIQGLFSTVKTVQNAQPKMPQAENPESAKSSSNKSEFSDTDVS